MPYFLEAYQEAKQGNDERPTKKDTQKLPNHYYFLANHREDIPICTGITSSHYSHWLTFLHKTQAQLSEKGR